MNKLNHVRNAKTASRQRGVALIAALITLLLIAAITAGMIILSTTETNISSNFRDEQLAFFSAKAGIEEVRDRMRKTAANTLRTVGTLPTTLPGNGTTGVLYILNPANGETVTPAGSNPANYADDEICKETTTVACSTGTAPLYPTSSSGWFTTTTASPTYAANPVIPWKWTRITLKQNNGMAPYYTNGNSASAAYVCWNGTNEFASATPCVAPNLFVYVLTTLAVTPSGSRRMIQTEIAEDSLNFTTPSALLADGTGDAFTPGASNQWGASGIDQPGCGVTTTGPPVDAIGVPDTVDQTAISTTINALPGNRANNYPGATASPSIGNVSSTMPASLSTVSGLQNLVTTIKNNVTEPVLNGMPTSLGGPGPVTSIPNVGDANNPQIVFVNGDLSLSGNTVGYGILVVTGSLTASGTVGWNGIVLVVGQGNFLADGTTQWNGAVVVAKTLDPSYNPLTTIAPGSVTISINGGGHGGIQYSSGCIGMANTLSTFHVVAIRELMN
jgi:Tfp pilus assembly protein PilX